MKSRWLWALLAVVLGAGIWGGTVLATNPSGLGTTTLAKSRFDEINVKAHVIPASIWRTQLRTHGLSDVYVVTTRWLRSIPTPAPWRTPAGTRIRVRASSSSSPGR